MQLADYQCVPQTFIESDQSLYSSQGNTIKKAYLCHSNTISLKKGDIALFYRSSDRKSIQCMGIVEDAFISDNVEEVFPKIAKRTVYTHSDLEKILTQKNLVILFRFIPLDYEISWRRILSVGIKGNIQSIRKISNEQYTALNEK